MQVRVSAASLTKIMTCMLVVEAAKIKPRILKSKVWAIYQTHLSQSHSKASRSMPGVLCCGGAIVDAGAVCRSRCRPGPLCRAGPQQISN